MIDLFNNYKNSGKISEALMIGQNIFNHNPENKDVFSAYFSYLCSLAETLPLLDDRVNFLEQAKVVFSFFCENVTLNEDMIVFISEQQEKLDKIAGDIDAVYQSKYEANTKSIEQENNKLLKELYSLKNKLESATTKEAFEKILTEIGAIDSKINKELLTDEQSAAYDSLTKDHTDVIGNKMRELERKKNVEYNKMAVATFSDAFNKFKGDESKYKNHSHLFVLASKTLFAFDASLLFNETLIYYNHVYSYIFSKLDDDGKLALTRYSIECERKLR